ncbi:hypothetical protein EBO15_36770 [Actinomadura harenae]|uniref:TROVE domain-containing protein n=1 Tax=Actinomadura harenae TaxID=2483351 RepID=A0A3M2LI19_9ACTN|nr:hypothetical protein EBO15_36770 [Actinomadura harenae]
MSRVALADGFFVWPRADRDRFLLLVRRATADDPEWTARFLRWLRTSTPLRIPAIAGACAFVRERLERQVGGRSRQVVSSVLLRADDPGHLLATWRHLYGQAVPKPVKRGVADAVVRLYDEAGLARHDTGGRRLNLPMAAWTSEPWDGLAPPRPYRFGDVIRLVHPVPRDARQAEVFRRALAGQRLRQENRGDPPLREVVASLRRLDGAGTPFEDAMEVAERIADPAVVAASGLGPLAFAAARRAVGTSRWNALLEDAAGRSLSRFPEIPGWTLVMVGGDPSARVFGLSLARRCAHADVIDHWGRPFELVDGDSPLHDLYRWPPARRSAPPPAGARTARAPATAAAEAFAGHDRIVVVETYADPSRVLPLGVPAYHWTSDVTNPGHEAPPGGVALAGVGDEALRVIPWVEDARRGRFPF